MPRHYQREESDWRRPRPSYEEERWSTGRSDDDFSMGLGQESRGSYRDRSSKYQGPERDDAARNSSRWQRSQFRPTQTSWNEGYEGEQEREATHREGPFEGRGPRNYKRSDSRIEEDINERLTRHGMLDATEIEVSVQNGEVTLRGSVDSRQAKRLAEDIIDNVSGVKDVSNQLKIKHTGGSSERSSATTETTGKQRKAS